MKKKILGMGIYLSLLQANLSAHCQMPCGIYHDNMVYDQIDQYVETMFKAMTELATIKFQTPQERNAFVRWVSTKDESSDQIAEIITYYFLQQKIKPGEEDTPKRLASAHRLLFLMVQMKQNVDRKIVDEFADEWEKFKLMFHVEGYECHVDMLNRRKLLEAQGKAQQEEHDHDHDHDNDHGHTH